MDNERKLIRLTEVEDKKTEWLWEGYLPLGAITDLSGDPAQAKSRIGYDLTARVSSGKAMPCSTATSPASHGRAAIAGGGAASAFPAVLLGEDSASPWIQSAAGP